MVEIKRSDGLAEGNPLTGYKINAYSIFNQNPAFEPNFPHHFKCQNQLSKYWLRFAFLCIGLIFA